MENATPLDRSGIDFAKKVGEDWKSSDGDHAMEKMSQGEDQWGARMGVFEELVEHHIQGEESKVFKSAEKALGHR